MTQALTSPSFKNTLVGLMGLSLAFLCFFAVTPLAHASSPLPGDYTYPNGLTESQVGALLNLMTVFGADGTTVNNVSDILRNNTGPVTNSGTLWCGLGVDKASYAFGENISVVWTSKSNVSYVSWVPDTSGKDNIRVTVSRMAREGQTSFSANVVGNPSLTMRAYASDGSSATCTKVIPVYDPSVFTSDDPGATIATDPTYSTTGGFWLSGKAWNTSRLMVSVAPSSYAGATDQQTLANFDKAGGTPGFNFQDVFVSNDRWSVQFGDRFGQGTFKVRVYDDSSCSYATCFTGRLLTTGTVILSPQGNSSSLSVSPSSGPAPLAVRFSTTAVSSNGALSIDFGDGYSAWFDGTATRTYAAGSYTAKLYQCILTLAKPCDGSVLIGTVTVVANATTSAMTPSAATVAVAPTCPPLHGTVKAISAHNEQGSCSVSTTSTSQRVAAAPQEVLAASVSLSAPSSQTGIPDVASLVTAAVMAPWQAAVDSFSQILYAIGVY